MSRHLIRASAPTCTCTCAAIVLSCLASLQLAACGNEPTPPIEPAPVTPPTPAAPPTAPTALEPEPEPTAEELPVADDFAAEAEQQIDAKSYRAELDALDKEISAEPSP